MPEPINAQNMINSNLETGDDTCTICYNEMNENDSYTIPECSHKFHTNCIVNWFRISNGICPYCRSHCDDNHMYYQRQRGYKFNRKFARRKDAPKELKILVDRLRKKENSRKEIKKKLTQWKKTEEGRKWSELNKIHNKMRRQGYRPRGEWQLRSEIGAYPIIPVLVPTHVRRPRCSNTSS
jgi:hypothetical protein